jgi:nucleotide-binding universal stress UspA family protein
MTTTLVTVRYPLTADSHRTIERGLNAHDDGDSLIILHVSLLQNGDRISRGDLQRAVEADFGEIPAHYIVRRGYVLEEAIVDEAARQNADHVLVGKSKRGRVRRWLGRLIGLYPDIEAELAKNLNAELEIVG